MPRTASLQHALALALPDLFGGWGGAYDNFKWRVPVGSQCLGKFIDALNTQADELGLELIPRYVDKTGNDLLDSPFELKHRKQTYETTVSDEFQKFWTRVEAHAAARKRAANQPQELVKSTTAKIRKLLDALPPADRVAVLSNVAQKR